MQVFIDFLLTQITQLHDLTKRWSSSGQYVR